MMIEISEPATAAAIAERAWLAQRQRLSGENEKAARGAAF
jgi:hypothetical protein